MAVCERESVGAVLLKTIIVIQQLAFDISSISVPCVAVCCSVLQCVAAVCCSALQCVAVCVHQLAFDISSISVSCVAVCCSVLQCVAVCCSVCASIIIRYLIDI